MILLFQDLELEQALYRMNKMIQVPCLSSAGWKVIPTWNTAGALPHEQDDSSTMLVLSRLESYSNLEHGRRSTA
jgi:hypothetical protein